MHLTSALLKSDSSLSLLVALQDGYWFVAFIMDALTGHQASHKGNREGRRGLKAGSNLAYVEVDTTDEPSQRSSLTVFNSCDGSPMGTSLLSGPGSLALQRQ